MSGVQPSWGDVFARGIASALSDVFTVQVGTVVAWIRTTGCADVQLVCSRPVPRADGTFATERPPVLPDVRVLFPQGGGTSLSFDLAEGDGLLVVCLQHSIRDWLRTGNAGLPSDLRTHHLAHAVAIPCLARDPLTADPDQAAVLSAPTMLKLYAPEVRLGDDTATPVALATPADANLTRWFSLFKNWTPVPNDGGAALKTAFTTAFGTNAFGPGGADPMVHTAASKVKAT